MEEEKTKINIPNKTIKKIIFTTISILIIIICFFGSYTVIDAGERGIVVSKMSGVSDRILTEGLHFKLPIIDKVRIINVQTKKVERQTISTSIDQQIVNVNVALNYHPNVDSVNKLYQEIGIDYESRIIIPVIEDSIKTIMAQFKAEDLIKKRDEVGLKTKELIKEKIEKKYITIDEFNIIDMDFSDIYNKAIEEKTTAEQEIGKSKNRLETIKVEKEQTIVEAEAEKQKKILESESRAESILIESKAKAESILIEAEAKAKAIEIIGNAINDNDKYIKYFYIENWDGVQPKFIGNGGEGLIINLNE